ncbi:MAG: hypothetical protein ACI8RZ_007930 [Myxococcota bacterium]|jgi:hypothetical protein
MMLLMLAIGCGKTDEEKSLGFTWTGGDFDFTTTAADDDCLDGALEALFMPGGPESPQEFEYTIYLPGFDEVPVSYDIDLRAPFVGMPVTVDTGADGMLTASGVIDAVALGVVAYGDCEVTMTAEIDMTPTSADDAEGEGRIAISDPRGEDGRCPVYDADPCLVRLTLTAARR